MYRSLAALAAVVLVVLPGFWLFGATIPVARYRAGDYTDFMLFAETLAAIYGGVALGVAVYSARVRLSGRAMTPVGILQAGVSGAAALGLVIVLGSGVYGLIASGSFEPGIGNLWGLLVIFAALRGAFVGAGLALLWYAFGGPAAGAGSAPGRQTGSAPGARLPSR